MALSFTYKGSEALEILKTTCPKTWENEIKDGQKFIKALMNMYQLTPLQAFQKFVNQCGNPEKGISTFASLHVMLTQNKIGTQIQKLQDEQMAYGNQLSALEASKITSHEDKKHYAPIIYQSKMNSKKTSKNSQMNIPLSGPKVSLCKPAYLTIDTTRMTVSQFHNLFNQ